MKEELAKEDVDAETINAAAGLLAQASMKLGEAMYKESAEAASADGVQDASQEPGAGGEDDAADGDDGDVVDADFEEVDGDKKK